MVGCFPFKEGVIVSNPIRLTKNQLSLFPFRDFGHYNEKGYKLVAKTILNKIEELEK